MDSNKVKLDRMRYVKDSLPSLCAYLAILLNVFYFVMIYKINKDYFYNGLIGVSVVTNLLFLLFTFLCSEEVKNYHSKYGVLMIALAVLEIVRIFIYPMQASQTMSTVGDVTAPVMSQLQFIKSIIYLGGAACFLVAGGLLSIKNTKTLNAYLATLEK